MDGEINLDWVVDNFAKNNFTFFEIGLAGLQWTISYELKKLIPHGKFHAFEAAEYWHESNKRCADEMDINYHPHAISDIDGEVLFYPSLTQNGQTHKESSSIFELRKSDGFDPLHKIYGEPYMVNSMKLETFCRENNITPDFIHIDVEGAELKALSNMGKYKPKCIWTEISGFAHYDTKTNIEKYNNFLESIGYYLVYTDPTFDGADALYCLNDFEITNYNNYNI
jgi:FkbM family methyltransferase